MRSGIALKCHRLFSATPSAFQCNVGGFSMQCRRPHFNVYFSETCRQSVNNSKIGWGSNNKMRKYGV